MRVPMTAIATTLGTVGGFLVAYQNSSGPCAPPPPPSGGAALMSPCGGALPPASGDI